MKTKRKKIQLKVLILLLCTFIFMSLQSTNNNTVESLIVGIWVSEEDPNWLIEFRNDGNSIWHYENEDSEYYNYSIEYDSPQCGYEVRTDVNNQFAYLNLTEPLGNDEECYEILGVNEETLSLSSISLGINNYLFYRQE